MNREQMIAWLILEGWEYTPENSDTWEGIVDKQGQRRAYRTAITGDMKRVRYNPDREYYTEEWDAVTNVVWAFNYATKEKDHEPR